jgi:hypothetical protein
VRVTAENPRTHRTLEGVEISAGLDGTAWVDLAMPQTGIRGRLVDGEGNAWREAAVVTATLAEPPGTLAQVAITADDMGEFELSGLDPGPYWLSASAGALAESERRPVTLQEDAKTGVVVLRMRDSVSVEGHVLSASGAPVPGATVVVRSFESPGPFYIPHRTDSEGHFSAQIPAGTRELNVSVAAPGFAFWMGRAHLPDDHTVAITVDRNGGTLRLRLTGQPSGVFLVRDGVHISLSYLLQLAGHVGENGVVVPQLAPGHYAACRIPDGRMLRRLSRGFLPQDSCTTATLSIGSEITLAVPAS